MRRCTFSDYCTLYSKHHQTLLACLHCTWGWQRTQMMRVGMKRMEEETMAVSAARELASED